MRKIRHRYLRVVKDYDLTRLRYVSWQPGCTCGWRGEHVEYDTVLVRQAWKQHKQEVQQ